MKYLRQLRENEAELARYQSDKMYAEGQARETKLELEAIKASQDQVRKTYYGHTLPYKL